MFIMFATVEVSLLKVGKLLVVVREDLADDRSELYKSREDERESRVSLCPPPPGFRVAVKEEMRS